MGIIAKARLVRIANSTWNKITNQLEGEKNKGMKLSANTIIQTLMLAMQGLNQASDVLPPRGKFWAMIAMSGIQGVVGVMAHFVNPDGTSSKVAYLPKGKG